MTGTVFFFFKKIVWRFLGTWVDLFLSNRQSQLAHHLRAYKYLFEMQTQWQCAFQFNVFWPEEHVTTVLVSCSPISGLIVGSWFGLLIHNFMYLSIACMAVQEDSHSTGLKRTSGNGQRMVSLLLSYPVWFTGWSFLLCKATLDFRVNTSHSIYHEYVPHLG